LLGLVSLHRHKVCPEAADGFDQRPEIMHIAKELPCIHHVFVHIIKIVQQHLAPIEKIVERLIRSADLAEMVIQHHQHLNPVGQLIVGEIGEQLLNGVNSG